MFYLKINARNENFRPKLGKKWCLEPVNMSGERKSFFQVSSAGLVSLQKKTDLSGICRRNVVSGASHDPLCQISVMRPFSSWLASCQLGARIVQLAGKLPAGSCWLTYGYIMIGVMGVCKVEKKMLY